MKDTKFKPGQSGNPGGRPALPADLRRLRHSCRKELLESVLKIMSMDEETADKYSKSNLKVIERLTFAVIGRAQQGDVAAFKQALEVAYGKLPDDSTLEFSDEEIELIEEWRKRVAKQELGSDSEEAMSDVQS